MKYSLWRLKRLSKVYSSLAGCYKLIIFLSHSVQSPLLFLFETFLWHNSHGLCYYCKFPFFSSKDYWHSNYRIQDTKFPWTLGISACRWTSTDVDDPGPGQPRQASKNHKILISPGAPPLLAAVQYQHMGAMPGA